MNASAFDFVFATSTPSIAANFLNNANGGSVPKKLANPSANTDINPPFIPLNVAIAFPNNENASAFPFNLLISPKSAAANFFISSTGGSNLKNFATPSANTPPNEPELPLYDAIAFPKVVKASAFDFNLVVSPKSNLENSCICSIGGFAPKNFAIPFAIPPTILPNPLAALPKPDIAIAFE